MFTDEEIIILKRLVLKEIYRTNDIIGESKLKEQPHREIPMTDYKQELKNIRQKLEEKQTL